MLRVSLAVQLVASCGQLLAAVPHNHDDHDHGHKHEAVDVADEQKMMNAEAHLGLSRPLARPFPWTTLAQKPPPPHALVISDNATQPFFDDALIASGLSTNGSTGLRRSFNAPAFDQVVMQPALLPAAPWEVGFALEVLGTSVVRVPSPSNKLRMYYTLRWAGLNADGVPLSHLKPTQEMFVIGIAESEDGVSWVKPLLEGRPFVSPLNGANVSRSNILGTAQECTLSHTSTIWVEPSSPASSHIWWAVSAGAVHGITPISVSADGIVWRRHSQITVLAIPGVGGGLDSQPMMLHDPGCGCHALFTRVDGGDSGKKEREVRRANIANLLTSGNGSVGRQGVVLQTDSLDDGSHHAALSAFIPVSFYGTTAWVRDYGGHRAYFMAPVRYWHWQGWPGMAKPARAGEGGEPATYDVALTVSRDGWNYTYLGDRQPFARPTQDGSVGQSQVWVAPPVVVGDDELYFVTRANMNEDGQIAHMDGSAKPVYRAEVALGRLRRDGAISIDGQYGVSHRLTTKVLNISGAPQQLFLNVDASGGGSVSVALLTPAGEHLLGPSHPIVHSSVHAPVYWPGDKPFGAVWNRKPFRLEITIEEAKLYSFRLSPSASMTINDRRIKSQRNRARPRKSDDNVPGADCVSASGCYLNGQCENGSCRCYPGWRGKHCGQFDLLPTPPGPLGGKAFPVQDDESSWGSSVIRDADGRYHMYSSGILGKCGLAVWAANAALTHSVSDTLDGQYQPHDIIMRGSNPEITQFGSELRLWHSLGGGAWGAKTKGYCATCTNGSTPAACRNESAQLPSGSEEAVPLSSKLIVATDPAGPWQDVPITCTGWGGMHGDGAKHSCPTTSNPTAYYFPNGSTLLQYDWQMKGVTSKGFFLASAPTVAGPYTPVTGQWNVTAITWEQDIACTDPFLWRDPRGNFHSVFHCRNWYKNRHGGGSDAGGHSFSEDGFRWELAPEPCWNLTVAHTDGTNTTFFHRERPQVFIDPETGNPAALINAVSLANQNQPFLWQKGCPPHPSHIQVGCDQCMAFVQRIRSKSDDDTVIVLGATSTEGERFAVDRLHSLLRLPVVSAANAKGRRQICAGSEASLRLIPDLASELASLGDEGFVLQTSADAQSVVITGGVNAPRGCMYGAYRFMELVGFDFLSFNVTNVPASVVSGGELWHGPMHRRELPVLEWRHNNNANLELQEHINFSIALGNNQNGGTSQYTGQDVHKPGGGVRWAPPGFTETSFDLVPPASTSTSGNYCPCVPKVGSTGEEVGEVNADVVFFGLLRAASASC
jgi:hypothetical protein